MIPIVGIGAGLVAALLFSVVITGSPLSALLYSAAPLPIFIASLGWNHRSGLFATAAGALAVAVALAPTGGIAFALIIGLPAWWILLLTRVIGVPLVTGISFEVIKFAGRNRGRGWVQAIIWPGMQLQKLTTREPDDEQVEVAITALEAVLAVEDPRNASAEDRVGVEVAA